MRKPSCTEMCLSRQWQLASLEKSRRFCPSPACAMLWKAAWQCACTRAGLKTAVVPGWEGAMSCQANLDQWPISSCLLALLLCRTMGSRLAQEQDKYPREILLPLNIVVHLYDRSFKFDLVQRLFYCSSKQVVFWLTSVTYIITYINFVIAFTSQNCVSYFHPLIWSQGRTANSSQLQSNRTHFMVKHTPPNSISSVFLPQRQDQGYLSSPMEIFVCVLNPPD